MSSFHSTKSRRPNAEILNDAIRWRNRLPEIGGIVLAKKSAGHGKTEEVSLIMVKISETCGKYYQSFEDFLENCWIDFS